MAHMNMKLTRHVRRSHSVKLRIFCLLTITGLICGCASKPPQAISRIPPGNPILAAVQADPQSFIGSEVRWGGVITQVENKAAQTWVEVVGRTLANNGRPVTDSGSGGRFIASFPRFVDPAVYQTGYLLTVVGRIEQTFTRPIGEFAYTFPVVTVTGSHLWRDEAEKTRPVYPPPWWYDPWWFYDPWPYYYRPYPLHPRFR